MSNTSSRSTIAATPVVPFLASKMSPRLGASRLCNSTCNDRGMNLMSPQSISPLVTFLAERKMTPSLAYVGVWCVPSVISSHNSSRGRWSCAAGSPNISTKIDCARRSRWDNASRRLVRRVSALSRMATMRRCSTSGRSGASYFQNSLITIRGILAPATTVLAKFRNSVDRRKYAKYAGSTLSLSHLSGTSSVVAYPGSSATTTLLR